MSTIVKDYFAFFAGILSREPGSILFIKMPDTDPHLINNADPQGRNPAKNCPIFW
jgi:hypothetical protein